MTVQTNDQPAIRPVYSIRYATNQQSLLAPAYVRENTAQLEHSIRSTLAQPGIRRNYLPTYEEDLSPKVDHRLLTA